MRRQEGPRILVEEGSRYNAITANCEDVTVKCPEAATTLLHYPDCERDAMSKERQILNKHNLGISPGLALKASTGGIEELRGDIQRLMDMEAIRQLKYAYFRCVDTANLEELATLLHEDVTVHYVGGTYEWNVQGRQDFVNNIAYAFSKEAVGQHNAHHPEIQMLSETEASAIWYLADNMWILNHNAKTHGTALYWDRYIKIDGKWLIRDTRYERVYEINEQLDARPNLSSHYLGTHGGEPQF